MSEYTVVVGLGNPENVDRLMHIACMIANECEGRVSGVTVVPVDCSAPDVLDEYHDRINRAYGILAEAEQAAELSGTPFEGHLSIGRTVADVLDEVADSTDARLIIVGFSEREHPAGGDSKFDRLVDEIAHNAPCSLLVARVLGEPKYRRVLVPVRGHATLETRHDVLQALRNQLGASVDVMHVCASEREAEEMREQLVEWLRDHGVMERVRLLMEINPDPGAAIVEASSNYDLVVIATAPLHEVRRKFFGAVPEYVANHAACSTFLVRTQDVRTDS
ncbi:MAG: universal stress protein [Armatimonadota bacterium]